MPDDLSAILSGIRERGYRNGATGAECARLSDSADSCPSCSREHAPDRPVTWSPAFAEWLCPDCRARRTDAELGATTRANAAARLAAGEAA